MLRKIPNKEEPKAYDKFQICDSPFIELVDGEVFDVKMQYPLLHLENAESRCFVRVEVYERLLQAKAFLPNGITFRIWDAWRPFCLQKELYNKYSERIINYFHLESQSEACQKKEIAKYVSEPVYDIMYAPVHTTGGAVDVTLVDSDGRELDLGTEFDAFSEETCTNYFESSDNEKVKENRRILWNAMEQAGFTNLPSEWWHFDYGDKFWAYYAQSPVLYKGIFDVRGIALI